MLISSVNPWIIIAPLIAVQYALALVSLVFLVRRAPSVKSFILWNILILFVFFAGSIAFFIYNRVRPAVKESDGQKENVSDETAAKENSDDELDGQNENADG